MKRHSSCLLVLTFAAFPVAARAQAPTPARGASQARPQETAPARESTPEKALKLTVECPKDPLPYYRTANYRVTAFDKASGGSIVGFPGPLEVKLDGVALMLTGSPNAVGAGFEGYLSVPLAVPPGARALTARAGVLQASCTVVVRKAFSRLTARVTQLDAAPEALRSLHLPGTKYLHVGAHLEVTAGQSMAPLKGQRVRLRLNGKELKAETTGDTGRVVLDVRADPGKNVVELIFDGNPNVLESSASVTLQVPN